MSATMYDIPDELSSAEMRLKSIYSEYRALKEEAQKKKEAEAAAAKRRVDDLVAEDASSAVKKLKSSGLLEKLHSEGTQKAQTFKRAGILERRLCTKSTEKIEESPDSHASSAGILKPTTVTPIIKQKSCTPKEQPPKLSSSYSTPRTPVKKSLYDSLADDDNPTDSSSNPDHGGFSGSSDFGYNRVTETHSDTKRTPYQQNGFRQKMLFVEADNVEEHFLRSVFEKFGPIFRVNVFPQKKHAFVLFKLWEHSQNAIQEIDGKVIEGITFHVSPARRQPDRRIYDDSHNDQDKDRSTVRERRELVSYEDGEIP